MARKRGAYQKRIERQNKRRLILALFVWLLLAFLIIWMIIEAAFMLKDINTGTLKEYTGSYSHSIRKTYGRRHAVDWHSFALDNGDVVIIQTYLCDHEDVLNDNPELIIMYSAIPHRFFPISYAAASITTSDGEIVILDVEQSKEECIGEIRSLSVVLVIWFFLLALALVMLLCTDNWIKRYQKRRKQRKKTKDRQL